MLNETGKLVGGCLLWSCRLAIVIQLCHYSHCVYIYKAAGVFCKMSLRDKRKATLYKFSTMPDQSEKERRKQIMGDLKKKADQEFESSLPMSRDNFKKLFDHLDIYLNDKGCNDTNILTKTFLQQSNMENVDSVLEWLADHSGYCDCEILSNVEGQFE